MLLLGPFAIGWIEDRGLWSFAGFLVLLALCLPLIPAGLAGFSLVVMPLLALSARRDRRQLQTMRDATTAAVASTNIRRVWLIDDHAIIAPPPLREHLVIEATSPVTADLEPLRRTLEALRPRHAPIDLHTVSPGITSHLRFDPDRAHELFHRSET